MDPRTVVEAMARAVEDTKARSGEERVRLVCAGPVGGSLHPARAVWVDIEVPRVIACVRRWARDGLRHGVVRESRLEVQKGRVFFK